MSKEHFSIKKRLKSFKYAFNGLKILILEEHNARIHLFAAICVLIFGFLLKISAYEWIAVCFAIGLVITSEIINSAIENLADYVSPDKNETIKKVKDLSAAAVLFSSIIAVFVGIIVFLPKIIDYVK
jgi:diacylglycerol kinase